VLVDDAVVRVMEVGDPDADPLLFLHGWGLSPRCYAEGHVAAHRAGRARHRARACPASAAATAPPLRGDRPAAYAARIGRLLDVLGLEHPSSWPGHSFGGGVALQLATERPGAGALADARQLRRAAPPAAAPASSTPPGGAGRRAATS
jgi:pimeloyl-ACP methyl ester carboxylesterase